MKVSKRDVLLLLGLIGILAVAASYFLAYQPGIEAAEALEAENAQLQARVADLSSKMDNKDSYVEQTASMNEEMDDILEKFPVDVREEDGLLLAINQELIAPMMISSLGISACESVILPDSNEEDADNLRVPTVLMSRKVTMNYLVSYEGLKRSIKNISVQDNRMSINNLSVSYDEGTGLLTGTIIIDMYCIPGQEDKEYEQPDFSTVLLGSDNIFDSLETYGDGLPDIGESVADDEEEGE